MKVTAERLPQSQVLLQIEVDPERLEQAMQQAYRRVVGRARIPGFRPGKAPRPMVERYLGREALLQEALDRLVPEVYEEALKQEGIQPIDQPDFELPQLEPVVLKATVPVRPNIDLGDYRALRIEPETVTVEDEMVDRTVEQLRHRYATIEPVERPVQLGDFVRLDAKASADGEDLFEQEDFELSVTEEATPYTPGLAAGLVGMNRGERREFSVDVPEDSLQKLVAGKTVTYTVHLREVKEEKLPELNDEFAVQVGEGFPTMLALRERLRSDALTRLSEEAKRRDQEKALDALVAGATLEYPPVLVEREIDTFVRDRVPDGEKSSLQRYLAQISKTEAELRDELRPAAIRRAERSLVLSQFVEDEDLSVSPDELEEEVDRLVEESSGAGERLRELFSQEAGQKVLERSRLTEKAYDRLRDIVTGQPVPERAASTEIEAETEVAGPAGEQPPAEAAPTEAAGPEHEHAQAVEEPPRSADNPVSDESVPEAEAPSAAVNPEEQAQEPDRPNS